MSNYTIQDVIHLFPEALTSTQIQGIEDYLNNGTIPPSDPCVPCEPNVIRSYIARIKQSGVEATLTSTKKSSSKTVVEEPAPVEEATTEIIEEEYIDGEEEAY